MKRVLCLLTLGVLGLAGAQALAEESHLEGGPLFAERCARCHGDAGGDSPGGTTPLKDQDAGTIIEKLNGYKAGTYGGDRKSTMEGVAKNLSEMEIAALAGYIGSQTE